MSRITYALITLLFLNKYAYCGGYTSKEEIEHPYEIGEYYCVSTAKYHLIGRLDGVYDFELRFADVSITRENTTPCLIKLTNLIIGREFLTYAVRR